MLIAARILVVGLVGFAIWHLEIWQAVRWELFYEQRWNLLASLGISLTSFVMIGQRLRILAGGKRISFANGFRANIFAAGYLLVLPARLGELVKPLHFRLTSGIPFAEGLGVVLLERTMDIFLLASLAVGTLGSRTDNAVWPTVLILLVALSVIVMYPWWIRLGRAVLVRLPGSRLREIGSKALEQMQRLSEARKHPLAWIYGVLAWSCSLGVVIFLLGSTASLSLSPVDCALVFVAGSIGFAAALLPGGAGTFEAAVTGTLHWLGVPLGEAVTLAILLRVQSMVLPLCGLLWSVLVEPELWHQLRSRKFGRISRTDRG